MRLASRGEVHVVHTDYELVVLSARPFRIALRPLEVWSPRPGAPPVPMPTFERPHLALSPSGARVVVDGIFSRTETDQFDRESVFTERRLISVDVERARAREIPAATLMAFLPGDAALSVRRDGRDVHLDGLRIDLPNAVDVQWPARTLGLPTRPRHDGESAFSRIFASPFGHALVDVHGGVIVRVGAHDAHPASAFRVPTQWPEIDLQAFATADGLLTVHSGGRSAGAIHHFSIDGRCLAKMTSFGNFSEVAAHGDEISFLRDHPTEGIMELVVARLPTLEVISVTPTTLSTYDGFAGLARSESGDLWMGNGSRVQRWTRSGSDVVVADVDLEAIPSIDPFAEEIDTGVAPVERTVEHPKFGVGRVLSQEGEGDHAKLEIAFPDAVRKLQARFVREVDARGRG
jgi:hypothetical protein